MNAETALALRARLGLDPDADLSSLVRTTDNRLSIGSDVWRLRWRRQLTTAVASDADLHTTCGALLDALALLEDELERAHRDGPDPLLDLTLVNVLVDRPFPDDDATETDEALRSMRDAVQNATARIWYQGGDESWREDATPAPRWDRDPKVAGWVESLMIPRLTTPPGKFALELVAAVDDPSLQLYPSEIKRGSTSVWALRLDGLEIGTASGTSATLSIGKPGKSGADGPQRKVFIEVFGHHTVTVIEGASASPGQLTVAAAADRVRHLLRRFRDADVRGAPISHRKLGGTLVIDEHTLEARLLKGLTRVEGVNDVGLVLDDQIVARGSQFPTKWGRNGPARYLDALLRRGTTPLAIELKVATGGQGRYYRRSLVQAVLYRHFIHSTPLLDPWFEAAKLERSSIEAAIGIPIPARWTAGFQRSVDLLQRVAARAGAEVHVLDDRATPDWVAQPGLPESSEHQYELLSWRLAAALCRRYPNALGRVVERHDCGGFYDQLQLQGRDDRRLGPPSPRPRISLNRPGSAWVFTQTGTARWTWREVWEHLGSGGDPDEAARIIGAIAGLRKEAAAGPTFADMAHAFLEAAPGSGWQWRCAWPDEPVVAPWVERYRAPLNRYSRVSVNGNLPTIARIWGAVHDSEAGVIVDQETLRSWVLDGGQVRELLDADPFDRVGSAIAVVAP